MVTRRSILRMAGATLLGGAAFQTGCAGPVRERAPPSAPCGWQAQTQRTLDGGWRDGRFLRLQRPVSVAADPRGLWILDVGHGMVFRLDNIGANIIGVWPVRLSAGARLRVDGFGQAFLSDPVRDEILRFDETGAPSQPVRTQGLVQPQVLALTPDGRLLVGDFSGRVAVFNTLGGLERVLTANGEPFGTIGGLAADRDHVYIADSLLRRIHILRGDRVVGALSHPELARPGPIAVDRDGLLIVADSMNRHIFVFAPGEQPFEAALPSPVPAHTIDDLAAGFREVFVADGATGRIHVLRIVAADCPDPVTPGNHE